MNKKNVEKICECPGDLRLPTIVAYRKISVMIVKKLVDTKITANQITWIGLIFFIISAYFFSKTDYSMLIIAMIFLQLGYLSDYVDGALSRLKGESSKYGHWLDLLGGTFGWLLVFIGITLGVYNQVPKTHVLWFGFLATISIPVKNVLQNYYTSLFKSAKGLKKKAYKKYGNILLSLRYTHSLLIPLLTLGALFDHMYFVVLFCGIYGPLYTIAQTIIFTLKARKEFLKEKKNS